MTRLLLKIAASLAGVSIATTAGVVWALSGLDDLDLDNLTED